MSDHVEAQLRVAFSNRAAATAVRPDVDAVLIRSNIQSVDGTTSRSRGARRMATVAAAVVLGVLAGGQADAMHSYAPAAAMAPSVAPVR